MQLILLESSKLLGSLGGVRGAVGQSGLLPVPTCSTMRGLSSRAEETQCSLVEEAAKCKFLDMCKREVPELHVPSHPNLL